MRVQSVELSGLLKDHMTYEIISKGFIKYNLHRTSTIQGWCGAGAGGPVLLT